MVDDAESVSTWHSCRAIGDDGPLWPDESYPLVSSIGALTSPGTLLFTVNSGRPGESTTP